ncbi:MAG: Na(+)/H(+) antiporter subunit D, partial [Hyphomicrobiaceae bacterium]|nr:Na(+)/H(+) antiporter subunit D [Hyphomicrobiaceae bacterium]
MISELNPGLILIMGALLIPLLPRFFCGPYMIALPVVALIYMLNLPIGEFGHIQLFDMQLVTLRVDKLSLAFGYVFLIAVFVGTIYSLHLDDWAQHASGMVYAGSAIGAAFAGDLITLFVFWELTAVSSVFLIWASRTAASRHAGQRYLVIQICSGLILLSGIMLHFRESGSILFNAIGIETIPGQLILIAFGVKCAFPLLNSWLQDSYPHATITGAVLLSAFTTKLAVYAIARGYAGTDYLIPIGAMMAILPLFLAVIENDMRRLLAHALNNQLGFMVVGVGIGTELALNGVAAHAFCHIIYKGLLFMAVGAVMLRYGTAKA